MDTCFECGDELDGAKGLCDGCAEVIPIEEWPCLSCGEEHDDTIEIGEWEVCTTCENFYITPTWDDWEHGFVCTHEEFRGMIDYFEDHGN